MAQAGLELDWRDAVLKQNVTELVTLTKRRTA
jgi:hypothetical protein